MRCRLLSRKLLLVLLAMTYGPLNVGHGAEPQAAMNAIERAVRFYREQVSVNGGSVYRVSADLIKREGENRVGPREAWIEPPATATVGFAYLKGWLWTAEPVFYDAMLEVADGLIRGQLESGGWGPNIEFDPLLRPRYAYRVDQRTDFSKRFNRTTFDDNKSQASLEFLMYLDQVLEFKEARIHEAATYALRSFTQAQFQNGAWPQQYTEFPEETAAPSQRARFPKSWSRTYETISYTQFYTLNDNTLSDLIQLMLTAYDIYGAEEWLDSARRGGDFLVLAQLPEPQPGWAQQYNREMEPAWARKFEPPAITGLESQGVMEMLMTLYDRTGDEKYLAPIERALAYYRSILLDDGQLARFYEIGTDRPLYFNRQYELTYTDDDLPTHYGFKVSSKLERLTNRYQKLSEQGASRRTSLKAFNPPKLSDQLTNQADAAIAALDARGAWVQAGELKNFSNEEQVDRVIDTRTYLENLQTLAGFVAASRGQTTRSR